MAFTLPVDIANQLDNIEKKAKHLRSVSDTTVVIGIGGSYLGAKAVIEALSHSFTPLLKKKHHEMLFAGHNISEDYISDLLEILDERNYSIIVISKSGTTTEPAIAFRILKDHLEKKIGKLKAAERIIAITDGKKGALRSQAEKNGYETFVIPDNIGGRYSVLTPVGLLPIAVSGIDIKELVKGAMSMAESSVKNKNGTSNPVLIYAAARNLVLRTGRPIEILVGFTPKLHYFSEWWKQLLERVKAKRGKEFSRLLLTSLQTSIRWDNTSRMVSGSFLRPIISVKEPGKKLVIPLEKDDSDQLNFLAGKRLSEVNHNAETGTILAHNDGNVPVIKIDIPLLDEYYTGQLIYFFELACAVSGYILDVNPFDQPGVEAYKKNMFALLNKPGFEDAGKKLRERLK